MRLSDISATEQSRRLVSSAGLRLGAGPFVFALRSPLDQVQEGLSLLYGAYPLAAHGQFADFTIDIAPGAGVRRWVRPLARFVFDGRPVFEPMPVSHAFPLLEWAMNWCVSVLDLHHLTLHAAVLEREGHALLLPAPPGSGKSTLCAALMHAGWRLLSDELALVDLKPPHQLWPLCRPVSLKNHSIEVIDRFSRGQAVFNRITHNTIKGSVSHMQVPVPHLVRMHEPAAARWVVFPRWQSGASAAMSRLPRAKGLIDLARNGFNYLALGEVGFDVLGKLVAGCDCHDFVYSDLNEAVAAFDALVSQARRASVEGLEAAVT